MTNDHMSLNALPRYYIQALLGKWVPEGGVAHLDSLNSLKLDFSMRSLGRIDTFLDSIRPKNQTTFEDFINQAPNLHLVHCLTSYISKTIEINAGISCVWIQVEEFNKKYSARDTAMSLVPGAAVPFFTFDPENGFRSGNGIGFKPMDFVLARIFAPKPTDFSIKDRSTSIVDGIVSGDTRDALTAHKKPWWKIW